MNRLWGLSFLIFLQSHVDIFAMDELREKIKVMQQFVVRDVHDIDYVKSIIDAMYQFDQEVRVHFIKDRSNPAAIEIMHEMDRVHTQTMKAIVAQHGWLTISKFGVQADNQAWLLVQHADNDPLFQEQCLFLLQDLITTQETNLKNYAYLYDRVALQSQAMGMKQRYGTQCFVSDTGDVSLQPYEGSMQDLDVRRQLIGFMPIEAYIQQITSMYTK